MKRKKQNEESRSRTAGYSAEPNNRENKGSLTISVSILIFFLSAACIIITFFLSTSILYEKKIIDKNKAEMELLTATDEFIKTHLLDDETPEGDSDFDEAIEWLKEQSEDDEILIEIADVSSKFNPNLVRPTFIERAGLKEKLFTKDKNLQDFTQFRQDYYDENENLIYDIKNEYSDFFEEELLDTYFTKYSYININITYRPVLENFYNIRTESPKDSGESKNFRNRIEKFFTGKGQKIITFEKLKDEILKENFDLFFPLINTEPIFNIHYITDDLLSSLLSYDYGEKKGITDAGGKKNAKDSIINSINAIKEERELTQNDLYDIIRVGGKVKKDCRIFQYIGTKTWFWKITTKKGSFQLETILARLPGPGSPSENETQSSQDKNFVIIEENYY